MTEGPPLLRWAQSFQINCFSFVTRYGLHHPIFFSAFFLLFLFLFLFFPFFFFFLFPYSSESLDRARYYLLVSRVLYTSTILPGLYITSSEMPNLLTWVDNISCLVSPSPHSGTLFLCFSFFSFSFFKSTAMLQVWGKESTYLALHIPRIWYYLLSLSA